jgi:hypothetical protein
MEEFLKYLSVFGLSAFKFIFGPTLGATYGFHWLLTALLTAGGMMTIVSVITLGAKPLRRFFQRFRRQKMLFTRRNRRYVRIWRKYGVQGVAFLTPVILMPWGGALLANAMGGKKQKILFWMLISSLFWSFAISLTVDKAFWLVKGFIP